MIALPVMKIALIGQKGIPTKSGGVEKHVEELSVRLAQQADTEVVAYTRPWYTPKQKKAYKGVRLVSLPSIYSKHLDAISHTFLAIIHASLIERADVIHIHAVGPALLTWLARILRPRAKVIVTFHCIDRQHQKWGRLAKFMLWLGEWSAMTSAHEVVSVSRTLQQYAYEVYGRTTNYIPNGISDQVLQPASIIEQQFGLTADSYLLMVSRLVRHKGVHHLINAYKELKTDKKLVIVGDSAFTDDYVQEIQTLAAGNDNIIFTGLQTGKTLAELFSNAYAFVLPSESEGLPIVLLEAAAYGLPIVASDIPANLEIIESAGQSFRNGDVADLQQALQKIIDQPDQAKASGKVGRQFVLKNYLWDDIAAKTQQLYDGVTVCYTSPRAQIIPSTH